MKYFKGKQFRKDIILVAVSLNYRDVSEILRERGVSVHLTIIMRWAHEYGHLTYQILKKKNKVVHHAWHSDETYIKIKEKWCYLYFAIDSDGHTLDFQLRKTRDYQAAYAFMNRLVKHFGEPPVLTTDKSLPYFVRSKNYRKPIFIHIQNNVPSNIAIL